MEKVFSKKYFIIEDSAGQDPIYGEREEPLDEIISRYLKEDSEAVWIHKGRCLTENIEEKLFFSRAPGLRDLARTVCRQCPVWVDCLEYALNNPILQGIWGGLTDSERSVLRSWFASASPPFSLTVQSHEQLRQMRDFEGLILVYDLTRKSYSLAPTLTAEHNKWAHPNGKEKHDKFQ